MKNFAKSILNYFATYNETRFNFKKKITYAWTNNELTLDLNIFEEFASSLFGQLSTDKKVDFKIKQGQYRVEIDQNDFKSRLSETIKNDYIGKFKDAYQKEESEVASALRELNLEIRKEVRKILLELQKEKIDEIELKTQTSHLPISSLNTSIIEQQIYDYIATLIKTAKTYELIIEGINSYLEATQFELVVFDLYSQILSFWKYIGTDNVYLFLHEISKDENAYPLILIELSLDHKNSDEQPVFAIQNVRDIVMLNVPAINSFGFDRVLTLPRATSFEEFQSDALAMERYLDSYYKLNNQFILGLGFHKLVADELPVISPRIGFQIIQKEEKSILDYSELITKLDAGQENKFIGMITDYVEGNVVNTSDDVHKEYINNYPEKSEKLVIHDLPISLNESQKKIITAVNNPKNKTIVVDGPPGTGKSYTITALIYNAVKHNKNVVVTSHKKQALDVIEDKLTEQFKRLHPKAKPSILRLSYDKEKTLNSIENTLSSPVINHANQRTRQINTDALQKDISKNEELIKTNIQTVWDNLEVAIKNQETQIKYFERVSANKLPQIEISSKGLAQITVDDFKKVIATITQDSDHLSLNDLLQVQSKNAHIGDLLSKCEYLYKNSASGFTDVQTNLNPAEIDLFLKEFDALNTLLVSNFPISGIKTTSTTVPSLDFEISRGFQNQQEILSAKEILEKIKNDKSLLGGFLKGKEIAKNEEALNTKFPELFIKYRNSKLEVLLDKLTDLSSAINDLIKVYPFVSISALLQSFNSQKLLDIQDAKENLLSLRNKKFIDEVINNTGKSLETITWQDISQTLLQLKFSIQKDQISEELEDFAKCINSSSENLEVLFNKLQTINSLFSRIEKKLINDFLQALVVFAEWFKTFGFDPDQISSISKVEPNIEIIIELINTHISLSNQEVTLKPSQELIQEYNFNLQKLVENQNDERFADLVNHGADISRILNAVSSGKRIETKESRVLLDHISCIIAPSGLISKTFPMDEDIIDTLIIDEGSQVSIADSISLILRAKQTIIFGDELQYGAVGAVNVSKEYSSQYFRDILDDYSKDKNDFIDEEVKNKILDDIAESGDEDEQESSRAYIISPTTKEWLKTFSVRTSTLSFCKALANYTDSLNVHFRSFPEIIGYSNEFFYKESQIPLVINRIRTKPIKEVLEFIKVETQGLTGQNINLDEIEIVKNKIAELYKNNSKATIGVICSFKEQAAQMEKDLRKYLNGFHDLEEKNKLKVWFVGDVQGEERDIIFYSFVEDKKIGNGSLRHIYPTIGGTAANIRKLKMQRLNVGFSRAKDKMVFVHSMPLSDYSDTVLGEALKFYEQTLQTAVDNYITDENIFGSPAEKDLYVLLQNTEFYKQNKSNLKIIAQFPIGKYIAEEYHRYLPDYRVDFLLSLSKDSKDKTLILEYDGLEYHFKDTENTTRNNFSSQYVEYDIKRQIELESYGYKFLRLNKFNLMPEYKGETKVEMLNKLLIKSFN